MEWTTKVECKDRNWGYIILDKRTFWQQKCCFTGKRQIKY